jgi:flagellar hook-basal body complex protein FliE
MSLPITGINGVIQAPELQSETGIRGNPGADFGAALGKALNNASAAEKTADEAEKKFAAGDPQIGIHEVMIAAEKAQIAIKYAVTLKNRMIEAYKELMNTPV